MMRGLVLSIQYEEEDLVQAEKEETDHTKEGETVQQPKIFEGQEITHCLFLTKEENLEIIAKCHVLTKNFMPYLTNGSLTV